MKAFDLINAQYDNVKSLKLDNSPEDNQKKNTITQQFAKAVNFIPGLETNSQQQMQQNMMNTNLASANKRQIFAADLTGIGYAAGGGLGSVGLGLGIAAAIAAFKSGEPWLDAAVATIENNANLLANQISTLVPAIKYRIPQCSYLGWLDCSQLQLGDEPAKVFLEKGRVAFNPGVIYSPHTSQFVRFNFATSESVITEAVNRIVKSL